MGEKETVLTCKVRGGINTDTHAWKSIHPSWPLKELPLGVNNNTSGERLLGYNIMHPREIP